MSNHNLGNKRNTLLDIIKGLLIIGVVVGHCIQYGSGKAYLSNNLFFFNSIFKFIYGFHMPLFMLICGYLFSFSMRSRSWQNNLLNRSKQLLLPIVTWGTITFFTNIYIENFIDDITLCSIPSLLNKWFNTVIGSSLWFLWSILYNTLIVIFINRCCRDSLWAYTLFFIVTFFIPKAGVYCFMYPYFVAGYIYGRDIKDSALITKLLQHKRALLFVTGAIYAAMLWRFEYSDYIYTTGHFILNGRPIQQIGIDLFRLSAGFIGSLFIILLTNEIYHIVGCPTMILSFIGKKTMGIYIISSYLIGRVVGRITASLPDINYIYLILESFAVVGVCLLLTMAIERSKKARLLLLGQ